MVTKGPVAIEVEDFEKSGSIGDKFSVIDLAVAVLVGRLEPIDNRVGGAKGCSIRLATRTDENVRQAVFFIIIRRSGKRRNTPTRRDEQAPQGHTSGWLHGVSRYRQGITKIGSGPTTSPHVGIVKPARYTTCPCSVVNGFERTQRFRGLGTAFNLWTLHPSPHPCLGSVNCAHESPGKGFSYPHPIDREN